jgi:periplasmic divalent cation tolerance protein
MNNSDYVQVTTLVADRSAADRMAAQLVEDRLAACVQIVGPVSSTYRWQEKLEQSEEWMCLIKTTLERYPAVEQAIRGWHGYELPEIIAVPIVAGSEQYLAWVRAEASPPSEPLPPGRNG